MLRLFFGSPGCGKSTTAVRYMYKELKSQKKYNKFMSRKLKNPFKYLKLKLFPPSFYSRFYSNFDTKLSTSVDLTDLGQWTLPKYTHLTIDESGIEFNNRKFKSLSQDTIKFFKLHRHYRVDIDFFSQSWEDTDITVRRLVDQLWYVKRFGPFTILRKVKKFVTINENDKQIIDGYEFKSPLWSIAPWPLHDKTFEIFLRLPYYKYFDSFCTPPTPIKYDTCSDSACTSPDLP